MGSVLALIVGATAGGGWAASISLTLDGTQPNPGLNSSIQLTDPVYYNYAVGALSWNSGAVHTFCIDLTHDVYLNHTYTYEEYPLGSTQNDGVTDDQAKYIQSLVNAHYNDVFGVPTAPANNNPNVNAAAMQLAIWEILNDTSNWNVTTGHFACYGTAKDGDVAVTEANLWLTGLQKATTITTVELISATQNQNQMIAVTSDGGNHTDQTVPVPAALPVGAAMLAGMAVVRKIRRKA